MSILIKGMTMPTSCMRGGCPIDGESCSLWEDKHWKSPDEPYRKRHPNCPLIELPPHGRLIDRDELTSVTEMVNGEFKTYYEKFEIDDAPVLIESEDSNVNSAN